MPDQELPVSEINVQESGAKAKSKLVTPEEFITRWPLYVPAPVEGFNPPTRISFHCNTLTCRKETTWKLNDERIERLGPGWFRWLWYSCVLCNKAYLLIIYWEIATEERPVKYSGAPRDVSGSPTTTVITKVQKLGQYPALSLDIPKGLEKNLGAEAISLYKKALANRNEGFGLGAVTYIRRVVEDKTNELIEVAAKLAESYSVDAEVVKQIATAEGRATYDQKLKLAAMVLPDALLIEGVNPLAALYSLVSEGVHALSEEECITVADETTSVFEFVFTNLRATTKIRHDFVDKVKKWAGNRPDKSA